jgi:hypothetical protein
MNAGKVPHVHRVERLIHLELSDKRAVKDACANCGVVHREWFEVEATRDGVKGVDEVIRRWCGWAEGVDAVGSGAGVGAGVGGGGGRRRSDGGGVMGARGGGIGDGARGWRSGSGGVGAGVNGDGGYY